ncbi:MAG: hypothetical protein ACKOXF_01745 [Chitinophagaceae bacterium]
MAEKLTTGLRPGTDLSRVGAGLTRGPNFAKKVTAAPWSGTWPTPTATLDLDFSNNRGFIRGVGSGGVMDAITFTRASNATYVKSDGTLSTNGLIYPNFFSASQTFADPAWIKGTNVNTLIPNYDLAPDSTQTATRLITNISGAYNFALGQQTILPTTAGSIATVSVYMKSTSGTNQNVVVGLSESGVGFSGASMTVTNTWQRFTYTYTKIGAGGITWGIAATSGAGYAFDVLIWGAQVEPGNTATTYQPTTSSYNVPRFDWANITPLAQRNLLRYSNDFTNSVWLKNGSITPNTIAAPDNLSGFGSSMYCTVTGIPGGRDIRESVNLTAGVTYTLSAYLKLGVQSRVSLSTSNFNNTSLQLDLSTGTVVSVSGGTNGQIMSVGGGWYRVSYTFTASTTVSSQIIVAIQGQDIESSTSWFVYVYGVQIEQGPTLNSYTDRGGYVPDSTSLVNNTTCNGLLIEESRTNRMLWCRDWTYGGSNQGVNYLTYSQNFSASYWIKSGATIISDAAIAPDSTTTASKLIGGTPVEETYPIIYANQNLITLIPSGTVALSIYAKPAELNYLVISITQIASNNNHGLVVDLTTGTYARFYERDNTAVSATVEDVGSQWKRITIYTTYSNNNGYAVSYGVTNTALTGTSPPVYTGDGTSGIYIWGAQLEIATLGAYTYTNGSALTSGYTKKNVTVSKDQIGIDGISNSASSVTASSDNAFLMQPVALGSGTRTSSVYLKRITGTGSVQTTIDGSTWSTVELSANEWRRVVLTGTVINPCIGIKLATAGDSVAVDYGQIEDGAFATSPILTFSASATRSADVASISGSVLNAWWNNGYLGGNFYSEASFNYPSNVCMVFSLDGSTGAADRVYVSSQTGFVRAGVATNSSNVYFSYGTLVPNIFYKTSFSVSQSYYGIGLSGTSSVTPALQNSMAFPPRGLTTLSIGWTTGGAYVLNGYLKRLSFVPKPLSLDALKTITGPNT